MFRKLAPLIILAMFVIATYFVIQGLENATAMSHPSAKNPQP
jgi:hypothetical protein